MVGVRGVFGGDAGVGGRVTVQLLVSPAEPAILRTLGRTSALVELMGGDFAWKTHLGWCLIQRKAVPDLLASVGDRLPKEIAQLKASAKFAALIVEGQPRYTSEGVLLGQYKGGGRPWTRSAIRKLLVDVAAEGIVVLTTTDEADTAEAVLDLVAWTSNPDHRALYTFAKDKMAKSKWGTADSPVWVVRLLSSFDGMSATLAKRVIEYMAAHHGGKSPLAWTISEDELRQIPGIGKVKAAQLAAALPALLDVPAAAAVDLTPLPPG